MLQTYLKKFPMMMMMVFGKINFGAIYVLRQTQSGALYVFRKTNFGASYVLRQT